MAIQDLINEVNSIQTKKQAIKEAITAKGVTSEGKLSKFADEIKKISSSEPYWYMINRIRHKNGNEGVCIRTNNRNIDRTGTYNVVEMGFGAKKDRDVRNIGYSDSRYIMNGTYFNDKEAICRHYATKYYADYPLSPQNDNYKIVLRDNKNNETTISFDNINEFSFLKSYLNRPTADCFSLYVKANSVQKKDSYGTLSNIVDVLNSGMQTQSINVDLYGTQLAIPLISIDSSILFSAAKYQTMNPAGFIKFDKDVTKIILVPIGLNKTKNNVFVDNADKFYNNLPMGSYAHCFSSDYKNQLVFVGINYIYTNDGTRKKNIEVYPYEIKQDIGNNNLGYVYTQFDKPVELYISFANSVQKAINNASNIGAFRKQVLAANGTPEA